MIYSYQDLSSGKVVGPVDVCIIGSGAGGAVMAHYLAKAGLKVVVIEKGGHFPPEELGRKEVHMLTRIEAMTIFKPATGKHTRVSLIAGECYGGGTVASESVTWDMPVPVLGDWERLGLKSFAPSNPKMEEYRVELNKLLNVKPVELRHHNPCNQVLMIGAEREGLQWKSVHRPVTECLRCGNCTQGCRFDVKQDMATTFLSWAQNAGADAYCGARVEDVKINFPGAGDAGHRDKLAGSAAADAQRELDNRKGSAPAKFTVTAAVSDRKAAPPRSGKVDTKTLVIHAHQVVLAAGPVGTSRLLLKSKINPNGVVGKQFSTHPTSMQAGRFDKSVNLNGWDGTNDTIEMHHFADLMRDKPYYDPARHGFLLEGALSLPWGMANLLPGTGQKLLDLMADMNHFANIEVNVKTDQHGRITEDKIDFDISERDNEAMLYGTWIAARIFFRAGAKQVFTALPGGLVLDSPADLDKIFKHQVGKAKGYMQKQANLYSGHIFGGAIMGVDPKSSFADETGECHDIKGLWVADGSAFPTNVGVNCALSISFVARKIADDFVRKTKGA
jgi:hypothetical protein